MLRNPCSWPPTDSPNYRNRVSNAFNLIGKSTVAYLTGQSWRLLKPCVYTGGWPEQRFQRLLPL